jgi:hypothetical protein
MVWKGLRRVVSATVGDGGDREKERMEWCGCRARIKLLRFAVVA